MGRCRCAHEPDPAWLLQDRVIESLNLLAAAGLAFDAIPINTAQFKSVIETARRLPKLRIVVNHLGRPPIPEQGWEPWASLMRTGAKTIETRHWSAPKKCRGWTLICAARRRNKNAGAWAGTNHHSSFAFWCYRENSASRKSVPAKCIGD